LLLISEENTISSELLPLSVRGKMQTNHPEEISLKEDEIEEEQNLKKALKQVEKRLLLKAFQQCKTTYEMAEYLGISQPSVVRKMKEYEI
jgi:transcriptional regulator with PAS, ATPase and Fis domain